MPTPADDAPGDKPTPMMAQYLAIKAAHTDALLFYRMGDFYELFFDDAEQAAAALDIALTKRGRHLGRDIPMCGVPVVNAEVYLQRLIRKGFRVAICEQAEDPAAAKRRGNKGPLARAVVRLVTPGTLTEDALLDGARANWLAAIARGPGGFALAWADISGGAFHVAALTGEALAAEIARLDPSEILVADNLLLDPALAPVRDAGAARLAPQPAARFDPASGEAALKRVFAVAALDAFGAFTRPEIAAAGALAAYLELTQKQQLPYLMPPRRETPGGTMAIDPATRRNLELALTMAGERAGSLIGTIDRTVTAAGARALAERIAAPLTDPAAIALRLDAVAAFAGDSALSADVRAGLQRVPDMARALARLTAGRGGPRDLGALRAGLPEAAALVRRLSQGAGLAGPPAELERLAAALTPGPQLAAFAERLAHVLAPELPLLARDGGFIRAGADAGLDAARALRDDTRAVIAGLEARLRADTGIAGLKIRHNAVIGYHVEAKQKDAALLLQPPFDQQFIHRQTMADAYRFTTAELSSLASRIADAAAGALALELQHFDQLAAAARAAAPQILATAEALAALDAAAALGTVAAERRWVRPVVDASLAFRVSGGRHPVVEAALPAGAFVANGCDLSPGGPGRLWLLTGPNMAGKSTFLRQNALIAILAQAGSFVPAAAAHIGIVDRLFSRVGAADDLARGRSTFMVEMVETAAILRQAGERALVILDEIGRGTATHDGLAIAWATLEHLHDVNRARGLFATHYHELTALSARLAGLAPHTMRVTAWKGELVFLHDVAPGTADRSYGIEVARRAGLPEAALARAAEVLAALETASTAEGPGKAPRGAQGQIAAALGDLPLFAVREAAPEAPSAPDPLRARLDGVDPDALTPRGALDLVYDLLAVLNGAGTK